MCVCVPIVVSAKPSAGERGRKRKRGPDHEEVESIAGGDKQVRELLTQLIKVCI